MATVVDTLKTNILDYKNDPASIQKTVLALLRSASNDELDAVDPTNPFVYSLECSAILAASAISENTALNRKQYPATAQTLDELYTHMSDKDYIDRFAVPSSVTVMLAFDKTELLSKLVLDDTSSSGVKKVVIPRNSYFIVGDSYTFTLNYPIIIRQLSHGGLQVVYDVDTVSPLETLSSNIVSWSTVKNSAGTEFMLMSVNFHQYSIVSTTLNVNASTAISKTIAFTDQYYYARVWNKGTDGTWTELTTTYSQDVYDATTPTALITVSDASITVKVPQIYVTNGLVNTTLRIDLYQTKGPLTLDMSAYQSNQYVMTYLALDENEMDEYVAPLSTITSSYIFSQNVVTGGTDSLSFDTLREQVISNSIGDRNIPITNNQATASLARDNYTVVKNIDTITNRDFLATRAMPEPSDTDILTSICAGIGVMSTTSANAILVDTIANNGELLTIKPSTLFKISSGLAELVSNSELALLNSMGGDQLAQVVSEGEYFYTPFYYVLDSTSNEFDLRPYHLDSPIVNTKSFSSENDTTQLQVGVDTYTITKTTDGYNLLIQTTSSDEFIALDDSNVFVQLSYTPPNQTDRAYINGTLYSKTSDNERIYSFDIKTNYAVDSNNYLTITNFFMYDETTRDLQTDLVDDFDIFFITNTAKPSGWQTSAIDSYLGTYLLPTDTYAISHEILNIRLGYYLGNLWARNRTNVSSEIYETYATDVPYLYTEDVYETNTTTGAIFSVVDGAIVYNKLHSIGDPVLDSSGNPTYRYRAGDIKYDANGDKVVNTARSLERQLDIFLIEGAYYFATNDVSISYRKSIIDTVVSWITTDLDALKSELLEMSSIYFYPLANIGNVDVMYGSGKTTSIPAGQSFDLNLYVSESVYNDSDLRDTLTTKTISTISDGLNESVVSMVNISNLLITQYGSDVISHSITKLGPSQDLDLVTMLKDSQKLSLAKKLTVRSDGTLAVEENVNITFIKHATTD